MDFVTSHFGKMKLWPVEHFFNIFIIKIRFSLSNLLIRVESNFDEKYVEKGFNKCSTNVQLVRVSSFRNDLLQNPYFRQFLKSYLIILNYIWCSCNTLERPEGAVGVLQVFLPSHVLFPSALFRPFFKLQSSKLYILLWPIPLGSRNAFRRGYIYIAARTVWNAMCIGQEALQGDVVVDWGRIKILENSNLRERWKQVPKILERDENKFQKS